MRYEKRMMILTGEGKGVVMIEKSALGVKFALRTFGIPPMRGLKLGIVASNATIIRDLPPLSDPQAVFTVDVELDDLQLAVFDTKIILSGALGKKMWQGNLIDILTRRAAKYSDRTTALSVPAVPVKAAAPIAPATPAEPVAPKPTAPVNQITPAAAAQPAAPVERIVTVVSEESPAPNQASNQTRYSDDKIAESDFYTPFDMSARMPEVDDFLSGSRILDGLSPRITPHPRREAAASVDVPNNVAPEENNMPPTASTAAESETEETAVEEPETSETETVVLEVIEPESVKSESEAIENEAVENETTEIESEQSLEELETIESETLENETTVTIESETAESESVEQITEQPAAQEVQQEAAAAAVETVEQTNIEMTGEAKMENDRIEKPWEKEAKYICKLCKRTPVIEHESIVPPSPRSAVVHLRETEFFERCHADIDMLFENAEKDEELSALLPDIEWIKVPIENRYVSVGRTKVFLCYAVEGTYRKVSPLGEDAQWLPKVRNAPTGKGYWLIFQDAVTGCLLHG